MNAFPHSGKLRNMASVYIRSKDKILLLYRQGNSIVNKLWIGSAGGHFEREEVNDAKACVLLELYEELQLDPSAFTDLSLRYVTLRYTDNEIRQNYYFFASLNENAPEIKVSSEGELRWFALDEISTLPMPFTARFMIDHYLAVGQYDDHLYAGVADLNAVTFIKL